MAGQPPSNLSAVSETGRLYVVPSKVLGLLLTSNSSTPDVVNTAMLTGVGQNWTLQAYGVGQCGLLSALPYPVTCASDPSVLQVCTEATRMPHERFARTHTHRNE